MISARFMMRSSPRRPRSDRAETPDPAHFFTSPHFFNVASLLQRHPDEIDRLLADIAGLVADAEVDGRHPPDLSVRRCIGIGMLGLRVRLGRPLPSLDVNEEHVGMGGMNALPLPRIHGKSLDDHPIVLEQILVISIRIVAIPVFRSSGARCACSRHRLEVDAHELDRRRARVGAAGFRPIGGAPPAYPAGAAERRTSLARGEPTSFDEDPQLVAAVRLLTRRLPGLQHEFFDDYPRIIEHHLALQIRERGRPIRSGDTERREAETERENKSDRRNGNAIPYHHRYPCYRHPYYPSLLAGLERPRAPMPILYTSLRQPAAGRCWGCVTPTADLGPARDAGAVPPRE